VGLYDFPRQIEGRRLRLARAGYASLCRLRLTRAGYASTASVCGGLSTIGVTSPVSNISLDQLRTYAIARSLFTPTTLPKALHKLGFLQADPIRAPARAQDLILRHRVRGYRAGDLERRYARLAIEEDFFVNYGFLPRATHVLLHPRKARRVWSEVRRAQAEAVLDFVTRHGVVHPRDVDAAFDHGKTKNWFGGSSNASTQLLDGMHYRGLLRVASREAGVRTYAVRAPNEPPTDPDTAMDTLVDIIVAKYAPLPKASLTSLVSRLSLGAPQWSHLRKPALARALARLPQAEVEGVRWFWPIGENPASNRYALDEEVRLLAPFDPVVWDRRRFEMFWGWPYRFEAYVPATKRLRGYYAMPLMWRGQMIGWANVSTHSGSIDVDTGYVTGRAPRAAAFKAALNREQHRLAEFLQIASA
jgi:uncharacterized protein